MSKKKDVATASPTPLLVDIPTAARMLSTTVWAIRELLWANKIPHVQIGRRFLIDPADLRSYIDRLKTGAA